ncbi:MAG: hypothetical protein QOI56_1116 [Actinomycetota bacterium]|jgi:hypothetical protein|nr:hypothetical protein [Actinomycetota bacterium]
MTDTLRRTTTRVAQEATETVREELDAYRGDADLPVESFAGLMAAYAAFVAAGSVAVRRRGLPERPAWSDVALVAVATHRLSRLVTKAPVTSPLRAPFTRFEGSTTGPAELEEEVRGTGARKAVGELLTCPFCISQWLATGLTFGLVLAPRATRLAAAVLTSVTAADFLQFARCAAEQRT